MEPNYRNSLKWYYGNQIRTLEGILKGMRIGAKVGFLNVHALSSLKRLLKSNYPNIRR